MNCFISSIVDKNGYTDFLETTNSTFYHTIKHLNFLEDLLHLTAKFIIVEEKSTIKGILPFFIKESPVGSIVNSLPFFGSYGGTLSNSEDVTKLLLAEFNQFVRKNNILSTTIITNPFIENSSIYEKYFQHSIVEKRRIQCINLKNFTVDTLWESFEQRVRRSIRKSLKENIEFSKISLNDNSIKNFFSLHQKEMNSKNGKSKPIEFFEAVKNNFINEVDYDVFEAKNNGKPISYLLIFYHYPFAEYYMPAYDSDFKNSQSTSLLIWESIKISLKKNLHFYNFGGTWFNQLELYRFKRGWNASDYFYNYYINVDINKIKNIGIDALKENFSHFYIAPYDKI